MGESSRPPEVHAASEDPAGGEAAGDPTGAGRPVGDSENHRQVRQVHQRQVQGLRQDREQEPDALLHRLRWADGPGSEPGQGRAVLAGRASRRLRGPRGGLGYP